ncbi:MAG TPA: hypothetical protein VKS79_25075 [Gemmataceae bacterium]|nr:hypothetical protein [Gemmataceae bacterium]
MRKLFAVAVCSLLLPLSAIADDLMMPDGQPLKYNGGLIIVRQGNQTTISVGGVFLPRKVRVTTDTPAGPVVTAFTLPSYFRSPTAPEWLGTAPAMIEVNIPDADGLLCVEGQQIATEKSAHRYLQSPPLPPGKDVVLHLRACFIAGNHVVVEDRPVLIRAGHRSSVTFDGSQPVAVANLPSQP